MKRSPPKPYVLSTPWFQPVNPDKSEPPSPPLYDPLIHLKENNVSEKLFPFTFYVTKGKLDIHIPTKAAAAAASL